VTDIKKFIRVLAQTSFVVLIHFKETSGPLKMEKAGIYPRLAFLIGSMPPSSILTEEQPSISPLQITKALPKI
jgi:hypothetical protein